MNRTLVSRLPSWHAQGGNGHENETDCGILTGGKLPLRGTPHWGWNWPWGGRAGPGLCGSGANLCSSGPGLCRPRTRLCRSGLCASGARSGIHLGSRFLGTGTYLASRLLGCAAGWLFWSARTLPPLVPSRSFTVAAFPSRDCEGALTRTVFDSPEPRSTG